MSSLLVIWSHFYYIWWCIACDLITVPFYTILNSLSCILFLSVSYFYLYLISICIFSLNSCISFPLFLYLFFLWLSYLWWLDGCSTFISLILQPSFLYSHQDNAISYPTVNTLLGTFLITSYYFQVTVGYVFL